MADQSDVEVALVRAAATALYPQGTANASVTATTLRIYRGWPANAALEADLTNNIQHVSVAAMAGTNATIEQFHLNWHVPAPVTPALTVSMTPTQVTVAGSATLGQLAGILVDDTAFAYRTIAGDTPQSVAAALAALIAPHFTCTVAGAVLTIAANTRLVARTEADQNAFLPMRRQRQEFRLTVWSADPLLRDTIAGAIDAAFAQLHFLTLADATAARLTYRRSDVTDELSTLPLYRRELAYAVEYITTLAQTQPSMLFGIFANDAAGTLKLS